MGSHVLTVIHWVSHWKAGLNLLMILDGQCHLAQTLDFGVLMSLNSQELLGWPRIPDSWKSDVLEMSLGQQTNPNCRVEPDHWRKLKYWGKLSHWKKLGRWAKLGRTGLDSPVRHHLQVRSVLQTDLSQSSLSCLR